jgi:site-specific DNA-adenine methylase
MKKLPQPIPYQGSKRNIARQILTVFPLENYPRQLELGIV